MKILNKKPFILGLRAIFCLSFLFIYANPTQALDPKIRQVRTSEGPAVYFLYHTGHRKKAYLNADIYLDYGNKWPDVKIISSSELNSWPDVKLIKKADSPTVYFIQGNKKSAIKSWADLESFNLTSEPILKVSQKEINYFTTLSYAEIGLTSKEISPAISNPPNSSTTTTPVTPIATATPITPIATTSKPIIQTGKLLLYSDLVKGANDNSLLTGSNNNLIGSFRFRSPEKTVTISSIIFTFTGLHSESILRGIKVYDENNVEYDASFSIRRDNHQATMYLKNKLSLYPGSEKTMKVYLDLGEAIDNQTIKVEIKKAIDVNTSAVPTAVFPLVGSTFKILNGNNLLGKILSQEESVAVGQLVSTGNRLIGKFTLSETSGKEDVLVSKLIFSNTGTAGKNDWEDFRLFSNGQIISRAGLLNSSRDIEFSINYLRISNSKPAVLTIYAALKSDRNKNATVNLRLDSLDSVGKNFNISLQPSINNVEETFNLN